MNAKIAAIASLAVLALAPLPARAATVDVEVRNVELRPAGVGAGAGDTVHFTVTSGSHNLQSYAGAAFNPGPMFAGGGSVDTTFPGGTSRYRCIVAGHSTLDEANNCTGMCGVVSSTPPAIPAPVITSPANGSTVTTPGADVSGTASAPATVVNIYDGNGFLGDTPVSSGTFSRGFNFSSGPHSLTAIALNDDGFESAVSSVVSFTVSVPDTGPPTVVLNQPNQLLDTNPVAVAGIATDDKLLASVRVEIRNVLTGEVIAPAVTCPTCGTASSVFNAQTPVPIGLYDVVAIARDGLGQSGEASARLLVIP